MDTKSLIASFLGSALTLLVGIVLLRFVDIRSVQGSGNTSGWQAREYLETTNKVTGKEALKACPAGFHMANMAEIVNPSALKYDTSRGYTAPDSGSGPPFGVEGWVRTGGEDWGKGPTTGGGIANCELWTTNANDEAGSVVMLTAGWGPNVGAVIR